MSAVVQAIKPAAADEVLSTKLLPGNIRVSFYKRADGRFGWVATAFGVWCTAGSGTTLQDAERQVAGELAERFDASRRAMLLAWDALVQSTAGIDDLGDEITSTERAMVHLMALRRG